MGLIQMDNFGNDADHNGHHAIFLIAFSHIWLCSLCFESYKLKMQKI